MKMNLKLLITSIFFLLLITTNSNAMPTVSEVILSPFKIITKPLQWLLIGWENKVDEYQVEITYNLEFDGKPLTVTKAINCEIYEGKIKNSGYGMKMPTRRVMESVNQIIHKIEETNETLILPVPGYCVVDEPYKEEKTADKKVKIIPISNQKKLFGKFSDKMIMSLAIVKFSKENPDQIDRIERVLSPKYYQSENARIKLKSYNTRVATKENPISADIEMVNPEIESRFSWINGKALGYSSMDEKYPFGNYKPQDSGVYATFGVFVYPEEIWSKIPKVGEFIYKIARENPSQDFFYLAQKDKKLAGMEEVVESARYYMTKGGSVSSIIDSYFGVWGINDPEPWAAIFLARGTGIRIKGEDGKMFVPKEKEKEWNELVKKSNYRDYYHPFTYNDKEKLWEVYGGKKGWMVMQKLNDGSYLGGKAIAASSESGFNMKFKINNHNFSGDQTNLMIFYNPKTKEITIPATGFGVFLK